MGFYQFKAIQKINTNLDEVWNFISSPKNLKEITPERMGFEIISKDLPDNMHPGMIIAYHVKPIMGIKTKWVTEITQVREKEYFIDEQRVGPYAMWHHQHFIEVIPKGVLMTDIVSYKPPLYLLGNIANGLFIKKKLNQIFAFRKEALVRKYGKYSE